MGRGLAAVALLAALTIPATAQAKGGSLLPWPSDAYTERDRSTDTGRRLDLPRSLMPANKDGVRIDPTDMNRADGFSPGSMIIVRIPGLDNEAALKRSRLPGLDDLAASLDKRSPVVVFNARTGKRHPVWAELDSNATSDANRVLIIRPAKNFKEGQRYVVVLRHLKDKNGKPIKRRHSGWKPFKRGLRKAGLRGHGGIYRAWSFTVASERSLAGRMLHIRDDAFRALGDTNLRDLKVAGKAPAFTIDTVTDLTPAEDDRIARRVDGTMTVPCYLTDACAPGGHFTFSSKGLPEYHGTTTAKFTCRIPRSALDPASPPRRAHV